MWPIVLLVARVTFLGDVYCRRVLVSFGWLAAVLGPLSWLQRANVEASANAPPIQRLKKSKAGATARFAGSLELTAAESPAATGDATDSKRAEPAATPAPVSPLTPKSAEEKADSAEFTARLLQAKKRVRDGQSPQR